MSFDNQKSAIEFVLNWRPQMNGEILTREFSIDDYEAAIDLWQKVEGLDIAEGDDRESVRRFLGQNPGLSRVATDGSRMVGAALCGHDGRRGYIYHLAVDAKYQGRRRVKGLQVVCSEGVGGDSDCRAKLM